MRSAGCVINDFADRKLDGHVSRTQDRPLATGAVTAAEALVLFLVLVSLAFILVLTLNVLTITPNIADGRTATSTTCVYRQCKCQQRFFLFGKYDVAIIGLYRLAYARLVLPVRGWMLGQWRVGVWLGITRCGRGCYLCRFMDDPSNRPKPTHLIPRHNFARINLEQYLGKSSYCRWELGPTDRSFAFTTITLV